MGAKSVKESAALESWEMRSGHPVRLEDNIACEPGSFWGAVKTDIQGQPGRSVIIDLGGDTRDVTCKAMGLLILIHSCKLCSVEDFLPLRNMVTGTLLGTSCTGCSLLHLEETSFQRILVHIVGLRHRTQPHMHALHRTEPYILLLSICCQKMPGRACFF